MQQLTVKFVSFMIYVKFSKLSYVDSMVDTMIDIVFVNFLFLGGD